MNDVLDDVLSDIGNAKVQAKPSKIEFLPGVGVDIGTSNIVVSRKTKDGKFVNKSHRNMLYPMDVSDESTDLLERSDYLYVKVGGTYYIVGEDALRLVNAIGKGEIVRPMKDGLLNPDLKESSELLFYIIKSVVGKPIVEDEPLRFSVPANPVDADANNMFHQMILTKFFKNSGFSPKPVNEAMCVAYYCNPIAKTEEGDVPVSGISLSAGAGMTNIAFSYKGMELNAFSITKSGDYIDESAGKATGVSSSKIMRRKEKDLDLSSMDSSDRVLSALYIYYQEVIDRCLHYINREFKKANSEVDGSMEIVIAGGTSMPNGYVEMFEKSLAEKDLPFSIYRVRHSDNPFNSVAQGACIRAQADYLKLSK